MTAARQPRLWRGLAWIPALFAVLGLSGCLGRLTAADRDLLRREIDSQHRWQIADSAETAAVRVALPDPAVVTIGRMAGANSPTLGEAGLRLSWPGSELRAQFLGDSLTLQLRTRGEVHFDVFIDETRVRLSPRHDAMARYRLPGLAGGPHRLRLQKRTEAAAGVVDVLALEFPPGGGLLPAPERPARRLEFIGDSMTVGACVLDDGREEWTARDTHCHRLSYAARVASELGAQHQSIAVSGLGISRSQVPLRAEEIFDRREPARDSPEQPVGSDKPAAVVILLGHNDVLSADRAGQPFPPQFAADYVRLVRAVRRRYPDCLIVCLTGGMYGSRASRPLRRAFAAAVQELQATDPRVVGHQLAAWSFLHPRAHTQAAMAREVVSVLRRHLGW